METELIEKLGELYPGIALGEAMDVANSILQPAGFLASTYDFSPVPLTYEGDFIVPTVYCMRNTPSDMADLWNGKRYYERDPVMDASREVACPFTWSYRGQQSAVMNRVLSDKHRPVVDYLIDTGMQCGITVPIRTPTGALATFSAICLEGLEDTELSGNISMVGHLAHVLHDAVITGLPKSAFQTPYVSLTPRERQCMRYCAAGLTTKQIAHEIDRSIATVTLHFASATRKLGARNRFHALTLATHYRLLDPNPLPSQNL